MFRDGQPKDLKWNCESCEDEDKQVRVCGLKFYEPLISPGRTLSLSLANGTFLDKCPRSELDPWALELVQEYHWSEKHGFDSDLTEQDHRAFMIIMTEIEIIIELKRTEMEQKAKLKGHK